MKKVNQDPFSNGSECSWWMENNCDKCVKSSVFSEVINGYTKARCRVYKDIITRMGCDEPIAQRTIDACSKAVCPYRQTERKQYARHKNKTKGLPSLFE